MTDSNLRNNHGKGDKIKKKQHTHDFFYSSSVWFFVVTLGSYKQKIGKP